MKIRDHILLLLCQVLFLYAPHYHHRTSTIIPNAIDHVSFGPKNGSRFELTTNGGSWNKGQCHSVAKNNLNSDTYSKQERFIDGGSGTGAKYLIECDKV